MFNGSSVVVQPIKQGMAEELNTQNGLFVDDSGELVNNEKINFRELAIFKTGITL